MKCAVHHSNLSEKKPAYLRSNPFEQLVCIIININVNMPSQILRILLLAVLVVFVITSARGANLQVVSHQKAQRDFCFPFATCCVKYSTCTPPKCSGWCATLMRRCRTIDLTLPRYAGYISFCNNAKTTPQCFSFCMSRKCGDLYCGATDFCEKMPTPWSEFKSFFKKPSGIPWGQKV